MPCVHCSFLEYPYNNSQNVQLLLCIHTVCVLYTTICVPHNTPCTVVQQWYVLCGYLRSFCTTVLLYVPVPQTTHLIMSSKRYSRRIVCNTAPSHTRIAIHPQPYSTILATVATVHSIIIMQKNVYPKLISTITAPKNMGQWRCVSRRHHNTYNFNPSMVNNKPLLLACLLPSFHTASQNAVTPPPFIYTVIRTASSRHIHNLAKFIFIFLLYKAPLWKCWEHTEVNLREFQSRLKSHKDGNKGTGNLPVE